MKNWVQDELLTLDLGDARLNKRCGLLLEALSDDPEASFPTALVSPAATKAMYRFLQNAHFETVALHQAHLQSTLKRCHEHPHVLAIHDTTSLDYTSHRKTQDLGYLEGPHCRGFFVHSVLMASPEGVPLGLSYQETWARPLADYGKKALRSKKRIEDKESFKWIKALSALSQTLPATSQVTVLSDQESDIFDDFFWPRPPHLHLLFRASGSRYVHKDRLKAHLQNQALAGDFDLSIQRKDNQAARTAHLEVRFCSVRLLPPARNLRAKEMGPVDLYAVLAEEVGDLPKGVERISWLVLTSHPVETFEAARYYLELYSRRWVIERYHYVLKSGCQIEALQLSTRERLERALALYSIVSWRLLWMTYLARCEPETPCESVFEPHEWQALHGYMAPKKALPKHPPSLHLVLRWVAQLGGFLNRKRDGEPGVKVLWKGLAKLEMISQTWLRLQQNPQLLRPPGGYG